MIMRIVPNYYYVYYGVASCENLEEQIANVESSSSFHALLVWSTANRNLRQAMASRPPIT
jgi:hypothetical protein